MSNVYVHFSQISFPARYSVVNFQLESHSLRFREVIDIGGKNILTLADATDCFVVSQLPQSFKYSKFTDLLRKSLLSHVWRVPSSNALSCKHERHFDLLTLASYYGKYMQKRKVL